MKSVAIGLMSLLVLVATGGAEQPLVAGQVRLVDGQPVAGAQVLLFDLADLRRGPVAQATADADREDGAGGWAGGLGSDAWVGSAWCLGKFAERRTGFAG